MEFLAILPSINVRHLPLTKHGSSQWQSLRNACRRRYAGGAPSAPWSIQRRNGVSEDFETFVRLESTDWHQMQILFGLRSTPTGTDLRAG